MWVVGMKELILKSILMLIFGAALIGTLWLGIQQGKLEGGQEVCDNLGEPLNRWKIDGELHCGEPMPNNFFHQDEDTFYTLPQMNINQVKQNE
jgi:hypothetical protein